MRTALTLLLAITLAACTVTPSAAAPLPPRRPSARPPTPVVPDQLRLITGPQVCATVPEALRVSLVPGDTIRDDIDWSNNVATATRAWGKCEWHFPRRPSLAARNRRGLRHCHPDRDRPRQAGVRREQCGRRETGRGAGRPRLDIHHSRGSGSRRRRGPSGRVQEQQPELPVLGCPLWRSSSWPAAIRAHCAVGRPSLRNCWPRVSYGCGQPDGESSQVSCRP